MAQVPYYVQTLVSQKANGTLFNTYTTAKSVLNVQDLTPIPGNYFQVGSKIRVRAWGGLSNIVTTPGTVTFQVNMGAVAIYSSGALQMTTTANTLSPFMFEATLRMATVGSVTSATWIGGGIVSALNLSLSAGANPTLTNGILAAPAAAPAAGSGYDGTTQQILDFFVGFSISNAGNGVQLYNYEVEQLAA